MVEQEATRNCLHTKDNNCTGRICLIPLFWNSVVYHGLAISRGRHGKLQLILVYFSSQYQPPAPHPQFHGRQCAPVPEAISAQCAKAGMGIENLVLQILRICSLITDAASEVQANRTAAIVVAPLSLLQPALPAEKTSKGFKGLVP